MNSYSAHIVSITLGLTSIAFATLAVLSSFMGEIVAPDLYVATIGALVLSIAFTAFGTALEIEESEQ